MKRTIVTDDDGLIQWGKPFDYTFVRARLTTWLREAGLPAVISPHSFHGSHAAHRLSSDVGHDVGQVVFDMDWSAEFLQYYLSQQVLTLGGAALPSPLAVLHSVSRVGGDGFTSRTSAAGLAEFSV